MLEEGKVKKGGQNKWPPKTPRPEPPKGQRGATASVWIVGRYIENEPWQFMGVFDSEAEAVGACRDDTYFIGPATLNEQLPHELTVWTGLRYPLLETT